MTAVPRRRIGHRLSPLLTPRSVAVVGASGREGSTGRTVIEKLDELGFDGPVYPVNPRHGAILGRDCYPSVADLPETVDLAVMAVGDGRVEEAATAAVEAGARALSIFGSCAVPGDREPDLAARLRAILREAGVPSNGANCMGFCNFEAAVHVNSYPFPWMEPGRTTVLAQSGSAFGALMWSRLKPNFAASIGSELSTTVADYMDYALELGTARVLTLFLETIRDPEGFEAALVKAERKGVPVVALKAGRSEMGVRMAVSHTGALAGDDRAVDAVFRKHGVLRADTLDELVASSLLMARAAGLGPGALATIHDSGGEREMVCDLADDLGAPFAAIGATARRRLADRLDYGLEPENPCDAFGTGRDHDGVMRDCFAALMDDPATALGVFFLDVNQRNDYSRACAAACLAVAGMTEKPVALATNHSGTDHRELAWDFTHNRGVPVLDGTVPALKAVAHAFRWRDWRGRPRDPAPEPDGARRARWAARLASPEPLDEAEGLRLLADYGVDTLPHAVVESEAEAVSAARGLGYPVALKTANPGVAHKSDAGGVRLGLGDAASVGAAWRDLAARLGPRVLVAPMAGPGVEMVVGVARDPQFGALVALGSGGVLVELLDDAIAFRPPVTAWEVRRALPGLKADRLLGGVRGGPPADRDALVDAVLKVSALALELEASLGELDINPLLVRPSGAVALDALAVGRAGAGPG